MPAERIGMPEAREVIRLKFSGVSTHARRLGLARSTVVGRRRTVLATAQIQTLAWRQTCKPRSQRRPRLLRLFPRSRPASFPNR
jgi:hypothetical protein